MIWQAEFCSENKNSQHAAPCLRNCASQRLRRRGAASPARTSKMAGEPWTELRCIWRRCPRRPPSSSPPPARPGPPWTQCRHDDRMSRVPTPGAARMSRPELSARKRLARDRIDQRTFFAATLNPAAFQIDLELHRPSLPHVRSARACGRNPRLRQACAPADRGAARDRNAGAFRRPPARSSG